MIGEYDLIPKQAFLFFPPYQHTIQMVNKSKQRIIFSGSIDFDDDEKQKISNLKNKLTSSNKNQHLIDYSDDFLLRSIQAAQFNIQLTVKTLKEYYQWQKKNLPLLMTMGIQRILKQGILYVCGRDCFYRPIIVVNAKKILSLKLSKNDLTECLSYFFDYVLQHLMIEGQVEQWTLLIDLGNASLFSLGKSMLDIIVHLSSIFKVRAVRNFLINCPSSIKLLWSTLKGALNEDQIRKISMSEKKQLKPNDFQLINPHQIEEKYGGSLPDMKQFWPITLNSHPLSVPETLSTNYLISQAQYEEKYIRNELRNRKIQKQFISQFSKLQNPGQQLQSQETETHRQSNKNVKKYLEEIDDGFYPTEAAPLQFDGELACLTFNDIWL